MIRERPPRREPLGRRQADDSLRPIARLAPAGVVLALVLALTAAAEAPAYQLDGLSFSPYVDGQDPNRRTPVSEQQLRARMELIRPYTTSVRSFGCGDGLERTGAVARELGLDAALGAWIGRDAAENDRQVACLVGRVNAGEAKLAIVGNEALLRGDVTAAALVGYIDRVKLATAGSGVPVATAEVYSHLLANPSVLAASNVVLANVYPYWEGIPLSRAVAMVHARYRELLAAAPGKEVRISETGWPSCGETNGAAVPSPQNAADYFLNLVSWARANSVTIYYFEAHDEAWKAAYEGARGACWGITDRFGVLKPGMRRVFDGETVPDNWSGDGLVGGVGDPRLELARVPAYGSSVDLRGRALHVKPADVYVAVYIQVAGGWWTKPTFASPRTVIGPDGTWTTDVTTGGTDQQATDMRAFLLPNAFAPPPVAGAGALPDSLAANALATATASRTPTRPVASFGYSPVTPTTGETVTFTSQSADPNGTVAALAWDLDDDGQYDDAQGPTAARAFPTAGDHVVRLRATDDAGESDTNSQTVPVAAPPPDTTPPPAPTLTGTVPASPANDNSPRVRGTAEDGSTVRLYTTASCTGTPVATGSAAALASPGLTVTVPDDSSVTLRATAADAAGNASACSTSSVTYLEDSTPPPAPTLTDTVPPSPANDNSPRVRGVAAAGSTVRLYANASCAGTPVAAGSAAAFASPGLTVAVGDDSTTLFRGTASDAAGNASACSADSTTFVEDSTPPRTVIDSGPAEGATTTSATAAFGFSSSEPGSTFACKLDTAPAAACTSPHTTVALPDGRHSFAVVATDRAGNADPRPPARTFTVDTRVPPGLSTAVPPAPTPVPPTPVPPPGCPAAGNVSAGTDVGEALVGTPSGDSIFGLGGDDALRGLAGGDCLFGQQGADLLLGGPGEDRLDGGDGGDRLDGGDGGDRLGGGDGTDRLRDGSGQDRLSGGPGDDRLDARDQTREGRRRRDGLTCGPGRDLALVDRKDRVADDCERVRRR